MQLTRFLSSTIMHASVSVQLRIGSLVSPCVLAKEARINVLEVEAASLEKELEWNAFPYPHTLLLQLHRQHEDADVIMKKHIKLLHKYNESKDVTRVSSAVYFAEFVPKSFQIVIDNANLRRARLLMPKPACDAQGDDRSADPRRHRLGATAINRTVRADFCC
jgi:hypothetical protein